jgi:OFA family oxalate/formate antiporter-like MFS transporter
MKFSGKARGVKLVVGVAVMLFAGIIHSWTILNTPFKMIETVDEVSTIINYTQLGLNYTLTLIFFCLGGILSGGISNQTSTSLRLVLSAMLMFSSFFVSSLLVVTLLDTRNYLMLYLAYGMLGGLGMGIAYNTVISTLNKWYPDNKGLCSGVLIAGFGLSVLIVGTVADIMGRSEAVGWRSTYVIIAITVGTVMLIAAAIIKPPPGRLVFPPSKSIMNIRYMDKANDHTALEMIKCRPFLLIFTYITLITASGGAAISFASEILADVGASGSFIVTAVGIMGIFGGLGRLASGYLFDRHGIWNTQMVSSIVAISAPLTLVAAIAGDYMVIGVFGLCLCGFSFGFAPTTCSVLATEFFGQKNFPLNFSILSLVLIPASFSATLTGAIRVNTGGFMIAFMIMTALAVIGFIVNLGIRKP